jgi:hypothetical protein
MNSHGLKDVDIDSNAVRTCRCTQVLRKKILPPSSGLYPDVLLCTYKSTRRYCSENQHRRKIYGLYILKENQFQYEVTAYHRLKY